MPEPTALHLDASTRRSDGGRTLIGGSPLRLLRLTDDGARVVDDLAAGAPVGRDPRRAAIARRLTDAGLAHPEPAPSASSTVGVVIPVRDHAEQVGTLLDALSVPDGAPIIVVDDGSADDAAVIAAVDGRATVIRRATSGGPATARNDGWRALAAAGRVDVVAFLDADVRPAPSDAPDGWGRPTLAPLLDHFADPAVGAVAPRIRGAATGRSVLDRYEAQRSPLDLGGAAARVQPGARVSYVPSAVLLVRLSLLEEHGGFDEAMRFGEDVDLVWRVAAAGPRVRYEPSVVFSHANRDSWPGLIRQRIGYGSSAAALDRRHPGRVPAVQLDRWSIVAWALLAFGGRRLRTAGVGVAVGSAAALVPKLRGRVDEPVAETVRLAGLGHLWAGRWLASALMRTWSPLAVIGGLGSRRIRRLAILAAIVPSALEWRERRPRLDLVRWIAARAVDDSAYAAGVWLGCARHRSAGPLLPRATRVPGLDRRRRRS